MKVSSGKRQSSADETGSTRQPNGGCANRRTVAPSRPPLPSRTASACTPATSAFGSPACRGNGAHYRPRPGPVQEPTSTRPGQRGHTRTPTRSAERPARTWSPPPSCASPPEGLVQDPHRKAHRRRSRPRLPVLGRGPPADRLASRRPSPNLTLPRHRHSGAHQRRGPDPHKPSVSQCCRGPRAQGTRKETPMGSPTPRRPSARLLTQLARDGWYLLGSTPP